MNKSIARKNTNQNLRKKRNKLLKKVLKRNFTTTGINER